MARGDHGTGKPKIVGTLFGEFSGTYFGRGILVSFVVDFWSKVQSTFGQTVYRYLG